MTVPGRDGVFSSYWDFSRDVEEKLNNYFISQPGYLGRQNGRYNFNFSGSRLEIELSGLDETLLETHGNTFLPANFARFFAGLGGTAITGENPKKRFDELRRERESEDDDPISHIPGFERPREPEGFSHFL